MAIPALKNLENGPIRLGRIAACRQGFLAMRVEGLAQHIVCNDAVLAQKLLQLLKHNLQAFAKLVMRTLRIDRAFEVIEGRQQIVDKAFFLRRGATVGFRWPVETPGRAMPPGEGTSTTRRPARYRFSVLVVSSSICDHAASEMGASSR